MDKNIKVGIVGTVGTARKQNLLHEILGAAKKREIPVATSVQAPVPPEDLDCVIRTQLDAVREALTAKLHDSTDADDWLFSEIDITIGDIDRLYGKDADTVILYAGSAILGAAPVSPTYEELLPYVGMKLIGEERSFRLFNGEYVIVRTDNQDGQPETILFSEADAPELAKLGWADGFELRFNPSAFGQSSIGLWSEELNKFIFVAAAPAAAERKKHLIWSADFDTSPEAIQEFRDDPPFWGLDTSRLTDKQIIGYLQQLNNEYLEDERKNLDKATKYPVVATYQVDTPTCQVFGFHPCGLNINSIFNVADNALARLTPIGFWGDGEEIFGECECAYGDTFTGGKVTVAVAFRQLIASYEECEELFMASCSDPAFNDLFAKYTRSIYPEVAAVYGWPIK